MKVIIVGAGTGGMCLAHGLRHAGIDVEVHERDRTRTGGLHGYRVGISPNGARALKACLSPELFDTFVATTAKPYDNYTMYTERFRVLMSIAADQMTGVGTAPEDRDHNVSRMTLRQVLFTGMEDVIRFDRRCTGWTRHDDGRVTAHFDDGEDATGDLLVGADGANSAVRRRYLPHARHTETGLLAIGGKLALTDANRHLLPDTAMRGMSMLFDRRGQFGIAHAMYMPWSADGAPGSTDRALVEQWPGICYDNTTDHLSWGLSTSRTLAPPDALDRRGADLNALALELTRDWDPRWRELVATSDPSASIALSVRTSDPLEPWEPTPVTLIGDAAHTMTPGRGAGANTALRDARELRDRLVRVRDGELSLVAAVGEYEELMRRYSSLAVRESLEMMNDDGTARRPIVGPLSVFAQRTGMRVVDHLPPVKRRIARNMQKVRDSELV
ncbi:FAD-dependent oxidoreductase [Pseudonocardia endophytica]|uniref:2-polyprenyl-6-methoxyphenol hydroxylase-like FAD-dependent oxidoreductase n=1 Tax=Pseudonocardia endophytica TaxID=401976 RepID=A0A4R1HUS6_PSEEN|nr:NAD(P)/FAD-dependent oxidoreductase [Pseudonocardia endophytica]TCK26477.1 2-polyprenyl-6-methoxyphenol hydroxylase-like FAD-dependent oxidoreductase [Pseudonocardia endophytica]